MLVWLGRHLLTKSQSSSFNVVFIYFSPLFSCFLVHERKRQWNYRNYREGGRVENGKHGKHGDSSRKRSPRRSKGESHEISKNTELPAKTLPARLLFPCHRAPESLSPPCLWGERTVPSFELCFPPPPVSLPSTSLFPSFQVWRGGDFS